MRRTSIFLLAILLFFISNCSPEKAAYKPNISTFTSPKGTEFFKPDSVSIAHNYKIPEWFKDAKYGCVGCLDYPNLPAIPEADHDDQFSWAPTDL